MRNVFISSHWRAGLILVAVALFLSSGVGTSGPEARPPSAVLDSICIRVGLHDVPFPVIVGILHNVGICFWSIAIV